MSKRLPDLPSRLVLVRHGETSWNSDGRLQGHEDVPLNENGRAQADALGARLARERVDAIYSSDLARALETAERIGEFTGHFVKCDARLRERHLGVLQGVSKEGALGALAGIYASYKSEDPDYTIPGGESTRVFAARVLGCIDDLVHHHAGQCIVVVAHGGVLDQIYRHAAGLPLCGPRPFTLLNASVNRLGFEAGSWHVGDWGDVRHLEQALSLDEY